MIKNYNSFLEKNRLLYYAFDWDDNILNMSTTIHMDKLTENVWIPVSIKPAEFAIVRNDPNYRPRNNDSFKAYEEFRDVGPRGDNAFLEDVKLSISENNFGPSWFKFLKCLKEGSLFAIVTARGHEYDTIKRGVKYVIDNCLTIEEKNKMYDKCLSYSKLFDKKSSFKKLKEGNFSDNLLIKKYLDSCKYYGVGTPMSESFKTEFNLEVGMQIEEAKKMVLDKFIAICNEYGEKSNIKVSLGFSDDDAKNVEHIKKYFEYKSTIFNQMRLNVYDTSTKESVKTKFIGGEIVETSTPGGPSMDGMDSSLLRFNSFNSMPNTLQFTTNDFSGYELQQKSKVARALAKDILKKRKKRKIKKKE